jgi:hypothetical protein
LRLALGQMFEREHDLFRLEPELKGKEEAHQARLMASVTRVTLSPGYEKWGQHLMLLERQHKLGLALGELLADEVTGLGILDEVRGAHRYRHPYCYACGIPQDNRFLLECVDCGAKYRRKGR